MPTRIYRGCHSEDEKIHIIRNMTAGGYPQRYAHRRKPTNSEAIKWISSSSSDSTHPDADIPEKSRSLSRSDLVEWTSRWDVAQQYGKRGGVVWTWLGGNWQTGSNSESGLVTWVCEPLVQVGEA